MKTKDKNGKSMPHLESTELLFVYCNIFNKDYQHARRVLHAFIPGKSFGQLSDISPETLYFLNLSVQSFHLLKYGLLNKILNC